jgi:hypothetical protein
MTETYWVLPNLSHKNDIEILSIEKNEIQNISHALDMKSLPCGLCLGIPDSFVEVARENFVYAQAFCNKDSPHIFFLLSTVCGKDDSARYSAISLLAKTNESNLKQVCGKITSAKTEDLLKAKFPNKPEYYNSAKRLLSAMRSDSKIRKLINAVDNRDLHYISYSNKHVPDLDFQFEWIDGYSGFARRLIHILKNYPTLLIPLVCLIVFVLAKRC